MSTKLIYAIYVALTLASIVLLFMLSRVKKWQNRDLWMQLGLLLTLLAGVAFYVVWEYVYLNTTIAAERREHALAGIGPLEIAAVWPSEDDGFFKGVAMAVDELNAAGGVNLSRDPMRESRRPIKLHIFKNERQKEDFAELDDRLIREIAENPRIMAVVGHKRSNVAIPASLTYEAYGLMYLAVSANSPLLTDHDLNNIARTVPDVRAFARELVTFSQERRWRRLAVLYPRTVYGVTFANYFREQLSMINEGLEPDSRSAIAYDGIYPPTEKAFDKFVYLTAKQSFDAIVIADEPERAARLIYKLRESGVDKPILASDSLESKRILALEPRDLGELYVASAFPLGSKKYDTPEAARFVAAYLKRHGQQPDFFAAQGYEAIHLLAGALNRSGTAVMEPTIVVLRTGKEWPGLFGKFSFTWSGDVVNKNVVVKQAGQQGFVVVKE